jgi:hypothetical protein
MHSHLIFLLVQGFTFRHSFTQSKHRFWRAASRLRDDYSAMRGDLGCVVLGSDLFRVTTFRCAWELAAYQVIATVEAD